MKIALINNLYKPYQRGGAEKFVEKVSCELLRQGHEVFVISTKPFSGKKDDKNIYYLNSLYYNLGLYPLPIRLFWHFLNTFNLVKYFQVKKIIEEEKPDLVITNNLVGLGFLLPTLFWTKKIKHLHILHDIQLLHPSGLMFLGEEKMLETFCSKIYQKITSLLFSKIEYVISPSNWLLDLHLQKGFFQKSHKKRIFNPIDVLHLDLSLKKSDGRINFLYVGQIEKHKGIDVLFEAMDDVLRTQSNVTLSVIGEGSLLGAVKEKYNNPNIEYFGKFNSKEKVMERMSQADCLLVPSLCYENSPTVIYEAAVCGLDFIYSDFGGAKEIGAFFGGASFNPLVKNDLEQKITHFIGNYNVNSSFLDNKKVLGLSAKRYIEEMFDFLEIS